MRRWVAAAVLLVSVAGCGGDPASDPVSHVVRYELNMVGQRAFADITAMYTNQDAVQTYAKVFAASWSQEVTVSYPAVEFLRLDGSFRFDTDVPGEPTDPTLSNLRCRISVDGVVVDNRLAYAPSCTYRLTRGTPSPVASR